MVTALMVVCSCIEKAESDNGFDKIVTTPSTSEYVDLGLPSGTLWANCNLGAVTPIEVGNFYYFGDSEPMDPQVVLDAEKVTGQNMLREYYKWFESSYYSNYRWYETYSRYSAPFTHILACDDAAYDPVNHPGRHMPSCAEWQELMDNVTVEYVTISGNPCAKLTSKNNSKTLILPCGGKYNESDALKGLTWHVRPFHKFDIAAFWCADFKRDAGDYITASRACDVWFSTYGFPEGRVSNLADKYNLEPIRACCYAEDANLGASALVDTINVFKIKAHYFNSLYPEFQGRMTQFMPKKVTFKRDKSGTLYAIYVTIDAYYGDYVEESDIVVRDPVFGSDSKITRYEADATVTEFRRIDAWLPNYVGYADMKFDKFTFEYDTDGANFTFMFWKDGERVLGFSNRPKML